MDSFIAPFEKKTTVEMFLKITKNTKNIGPNDCVVYFKYIINIFTYTNSSLQSVVSKGISFHWFISIA